ncbi:MAG: hypothetical protein MJ135_02050 [Oscillospiraceae bacterium]|nr:hypothetical protein [Oscillospiraceae bacterium]
MLSINPSEVIWTIVNFFLLFFLLNRFLYRPLLRFMDERAARLNSGAENKEIAKTAIMEAEAEAEALCAAAESEAATQMRKAEEENDRLDKEAVRNARAAAKVARAAAHQDAGRIAKEEENELAAHRKMLALEVARSLVLSYGKEK